ncbi:hypothetical protein N9E98_00005, partial [Candidatus Pelagibacter sp.]|nr:hypothetical protein [Candidatus Pelagibacter sp.]
MALDGECVKDVNGSLVISDDGRDGTQKFQDTEADPAVDVLAPFKYADGYVETEGVGTKSGTSGNHANNCQTQPDEYLVKFFKVALCLEDPYTEDVSPDFTSCTDIFNKTDGKEITIKPDTEEKLLEGDLRIPIGNYLVLIAVVSNHLKIKHKQKYVFENAETHGRVTMHGKGDSFSDNLSNTDLCYTIDIVTTYNGQTYDANFKNQHGISSKTIVAPQGSAAGATLECVNTGTSGADFNFATEIIDHLGSGATFGSSQNYASTLASTGVNVQMAGQMLRTDNATIADDVDNALRIGAYFKYNSPIRIREN